MSQLDKARDAYIAKWREGYSDEPVVDIDALEAAITAFLSTPPSPAAGEQGEGLAAECLEAAEIEGRSDGTQTTIATLTRAANALTALTADNAAKQKLLDEADVFVSQQMRLIAEKHEAERQRDELREALNKIKARVVGEAIPHWNGEPNSTNSRCWIADRCDEALSTLPAEQPCKACAGHGCMDDSGATCPACNGTRVEQKDVT